MKPTLLALHGYTMNGARLREMASELFEGFDEHVNLIFPDAPHTCSPDVATAAFERWRIEPPEPPYLSWWRANEDGSVYAGWETTREFVRTLISHDAPFGVFGFSQGAMLAATLSALSIRGLFPKPCFAVCVAGGVPRARDLEPLFTHPIAIPSLHVWGQRDPIAASSAPKLSGCFQKSERETLVWSGSHAIPKLEQPARTIRRFMLQRLELASKS